MSLDRDKQETQGEAERERARGEREGDMTTTRAPGDPFQDSRCCKNGAGRNWGLPIANHGTYLISAPPTRRHHNQPPQPSPHSVEKDTAHARSQEARAFRLSPRSCFDGMSGPPSWRSAYVWSSHDAADGIPSKATAEGRFTSLAGNAVSHERSNGDHCTSTSDAFFCQWHFTPAQYCAKAAK